jgi:membrane protein YqaA with SNARE-associated domain
MILDLATCFVLSFAGFGAATILPMQPEPVLVGLLLTGKFSTLLLLLVASIANTLGSVLNWFLGRGIERFRDRKWFPVSNKALDRSCPVVSALRKMVATVVVDAGLTVIAGALREPLLTFTILVFIAKAGRYLVFALVTLQIFG